MDGIVGETKQKSLTEEKMESSSNSYSYGKVDPEEIIRRLKGIIEYLKTKSVKSPNE